MAAAIVKLDALADAVGSAAEDHDPLFAWLLGRRFVFLFVGAVVIRRVGLELGRAGIDRLVGGHDAAGLAAVADRHFAGVPDRRELPIGETELLGTASEVVRG